MPLARASARPRWPCCSSGRTCPPGCGTCSPLRWTETAAAGGHSGWRPRRRRCRPAASVVARSRRRLEDLADGVVDGIAEHPVAPDTGDLERDYVRSGFCAVGQRLSSLRGGERGGHLCALPVQAIQCAGTDQAFERLAIEDSALDHAGGEGMHGEMFWAALQAAAASCVVAVSAAFRAAGPRLVAATGAARAIPARAVGFSTGSH